MQNYHFYLYEFLKCIEDGDNKKAHRIKDQSIPKTLYKFFGLFEAPECSECKSMEKCHCKKCGANEQCQLLIKNFTKLQSIENNQLWLSSVDELNDPFEFMALYPDKNRSNGNEENTFKLLAYLKNEIRVSCFAGKKPIHDMPMWAHYANSHKGFCIEYTIKNSSLFLQIQYSSERIPIATIPAYIYSSISKAMSEGKQELDLKAQAYIIYLTLSAMVKSDHWVYENEYRLIYPTQNPDKNGELIPLEDLGLKMKHIYIGKSCNEEYRTRLLTMARTNKLPVSFIFLDEYSPEYKLNSRLVEQHG